MTATFFAPGDLWVQTHTGVAFDLLAPTAAMVRAEDLTHTLAYLPRFGGSLRTHYSVAQHSVLCAALVWRRTRDRNAALVALLPDAHEAHTGDIKGPVKALIETWAPGKLGEIERGIDRAIHAWAGVVAHGPEVTAEVKRADRELLIWERDRWLGEPARPWFCEGVRRLWFADFGAGSYDLRALDASDANLLFGGLLSRLIDDTRPLWGEGALRMMFAGLGEERGA